MKINFFKLNRNRRFNYTPRYYKGKEEVNDPSGISRFNFESRFSKLGMHIIKTILVRGGVMKEKK